jgi:hypothetical protein
MRRQQVRKMAVEALGLEHAVILVCRTKRLKRKKKKKKKKKPNEQETKFKRDRRGKRKKSWDTQISLKRKLPEYIAFMWSGLMMHLLLDIVRVVEGVITELGSERLEALLILRHLVL